ncbi:MAG: FMN-dependent NADH-azoreductase [Halomonas sp.]|uniref:FMN-dependent NADH-azoreductase n=1 Tax=unclassified Halomonas TaxID=2609666 RepID=UPI0026501439|nr:NAD(P)H-dependent oxidoreductase [Halomonas sp.]
MNNTLFIHASPHGKHALGYRLAQKILAEGALTNSRVSLVERDLLAAPLSPLTQHYASALVSHNIGDSIDAALTESEQLISELEQSDRLLIATPMHNFSVPAALKLWIDHVVRVNRTFIASAEGKQGLLQDRPTTVLVSAGGMLQGDNPQPDFLTPYLTLILNTIGIRNIHFAYLQGLAFGEPAIDKAWHQAQAALIEADVLTNEIP